MAMLFSSSLRLAMLSAGAQRSIKAALEQWDMSHYGSQPDPAKMHTARSRAGSVPQRSNSSHSHSSRRCLQLLLLAVLLHHEQAAAMSLDRLALERNELPVEQQSQPQPDVLVDDMKLTSIPSADSASDMYMLIPETVASQLEDTEHVNRNSIESDSGSEDQPAPAPTC